MMNAMLKIGTSGYSFNDWIGEFYPEDIQKGKMLDFYVNHFNTVEINSTYYGIPNKQVFYHLNRKTPSDFEFIVKLHKTTTHLEVKDPTTTESILESVSPISDSGKLHGLLAQFPFSFRMTPINLEYLEKVQEYCHSIPLFVEFRHKSWDQEPVYAFLKEHKIGYCCVDEPQLLNLLPPQAIATTQTGYIRFHGRNQQTWWDSSKGDRYDYFYKENELNEWLGRLRELRRTTAKTYVFFNNCHQGSAVKNAKMLIEMLKKNNELLPSAFAIVNQ